jgi:1-acyl-sn-glycerol-3-phosphate acyltransferase
MNTRRTKQSAEYRSPVLLRSAFVHRFMVAYFRRYFSRRMNGLRLAAWGSPQTPAGAPVIVFSNHPSWWDAAIYILAADHFMAERTSFAPIDAQMLEQYGILGRIGAFGVDLQTRRGATEFLTASADILSKPDRSLWITAQGRFSDVRERPLGLKPGVAKLAEIAPNATFLPLAVEYGFWMESSAEAFMAFGEPISASTLTRLPRTQRLGHLEQALTLTLDRLSADVASREPQRFREILSGRKGIGGIYDFWRGAAAAVRGKRFDASHEGHAA